MTDAKTPPAPAGASAEISQEQLEQLMRQEIAGHLGMLVAAFAPHVRLETLEPLVEALIKEQLVIQQEVLPTLQLPGELWIYVDAGEGTRDGHFKAQRRFQECGRDPALGIATALLYGFLLMPGIRGLLRLYGFRYRFQAPKTVDRKNIILHG